MYLYVVALRAVVVMWRSSSHLCVSRFFQIVKLLALSTFVHSYAIDFWACLGQLEMEQTNPSLLFAFRTLSYIRHQFKLKEESDWQCRMHVIGRQRTNQSVFSSADHWPEGELLLKQNNRGDRMGRICYFYCMVILYQKVKPNKHGDIMGRICYFYCVVISKGEAK